MSKLLVLILFISPVAFAQSNEPSEVTLAPIELEKIDKSARASESKATITKDDLELRQTQTLADALREIEGVTIVNSGGPGKPSSVFIRGANADHVLIIINGVELTDLLSPSRAATLDDIFSDDVEKIEVLRGPQTLRYGPSALNGVISITTKKGAGPSKRVVKAEIGKYQTANGMIGITGGDPDSNYDIRYSQFQTSGFSAADENLPGNNEPDRSSQSQVTARLGAAPIKNLDLDLSVRYTDTNNDIDLGGGPNQDDPNYTTKTRKLLTSLQSHSEFQNKFIEINNSIALEKFDRSSQNYPDVNNPATLSENYKGQLLRASTNASLNWTRQQTTTVGADFKEDRGTSDQFAGEKANQFIGAFATHSYSAAHGFFFDLGARWDEQLKNSENDFTTQNGIGYAFSQSTKIHAGIGTSIKQPGLYQLYSLYGDPNLQTEKGRSAEVGIEHLFAQNFGRLATTLFYNHFTDLIDFANSKYQNSGEAETFGAELAAKTPISAGILIGGTYTFLRTHSLINGLPLLRRPSESASADLQLNFTQNFQVIHSTDFVGTRDDFNELGGRITLDSHFVSRLVINYQVQKDAKMYLRIENLYDRKYEETYGFGTSRRAAYVGFSSQF